MRIGIVGGTGREGRGIAIRWAASGHAVTIGSREASRGAEKAAELAATHHVPLTGTDNVGACRDADVVLLSIPFSGHAATVEELAPALAGKIVIDLTVPLKPPTVRTVHLPESKAACLATQAILGSEARVVGALHHISSEHLGDPDHPIDCDVLVCGDDAEARAVVVGLVADLGLRGIEAGALANAIALESLTPVLLFINKKYGASGAGIRITGLPGKS
jgi:8-hydroxy-5-deazaflavin:NADPH oxidoreductase